jgi:hypothetical protein
MQIFGILEHLFPFATFIATIFDIFPYFFPFFTPGEGATANKANFGG